MVHKLIAQTTRTLDPIEGLGPLGGEGGVFNTPDPKVTLLKFENTISVTVGVLTISAGIWFIFQIFSGAYQWLASGGEKQALQNAQKRIGNGIIGLFVVVVSYTLIAIIGKIIGLDILTPAQTVIDKIKI